MELLFTNFVSAQLAVAVNDSETQLQVEPGQGDLFPSPIDDEYAVLVLEYDLGAKEIVYLTARDGDILTVVRGREFTSTNNYSIGTRVESRLTEGSLLEYGKELIDGHVNKADPHSIYVTEIETDSVFAPKGTADNIQNQLESHENNVDIHFPDAPADNRIYARKNFTWVNPYTGEPYTTSRAYISDLPPPVPRENPLWFNSNTGLFSIYYSDGTSDQWVEVGPGVPASSPGEPPVTGQNPPLVGPEPVTVVGPVDADNANTRSIFTDIPAGIGRVVVVLNRLGCNTTNDPVVKITLGGVDIDAGYVGRTTRTVASGSTQYAWGDAPQGGVKYDVPSGSVTASRHCGSIEFRYLASAGGTTRWSINGLLSDVRTSPVPNAIQLNGYVDTTSAVSNVLSRITFQQVVGGASLYNNGAIKSYCYAV